MENDANVKNRIFFKLLAVFLIVIAATATILDVMLSGEFKSSTSARPATAESGSDPENPRYLKTVRGAGYRFEVPK